MKYSSQIVPGTVFLDLFTNDSDYVNRTLLPLFFRIQKVVENFLDGFLILFRGYLISKSLVDRNFVNLLKQVIFQL